MSVPVNYSPPQLKHCFIVRSALARFDFGQGSTLSMVPEAAYVIEAAHAVTAL